MELASLNQTFLLGKQIDIRTGVLYIPEKLSVGLAYFHEALAPPDEGHYSSENVPGSSGLDLQFVLGDSQ